MFHLYFHYSFGFLCSKHTSYNFLKTFTLLFCSHISPTSIGTLRASIIYFFWNKKRVNQSPIVSRRGTDIPNFEMYSKIKIKIILSCFQNMCCGPAGWCAFCGPPCGGPFCKACCIEVCCHPCTPAYLQCNQNCSLGC